MIQEFLAGNFSDLILNGTAVSPRKFGRRTSFSALTSSMWTRLLIGSTSFLEANSEILFGPFHQAYRHISAALGNSKGPKYKNAHITVAT